MSRLWTFVTLLMASAACFGQAAAPTPDPAKAASALPSLPKKPDEVIAAAAPFYNFENSALKPWHMTVSYQLFDEESKPGETGTFDYWWAAPDTYRLRWRRGSSERSIWVAYGVVYREVKGPVLGYFEQELEPSLMPKIGALTRGLPDNWKMERHEIQFGKAKLPCVEAGPAELFEQFESPSLPAGLSLYCFEPDHPLLRVYAPSGATAVSYGSLARTQGLILPRELTMYSQTRKGLFAKVVSVEGIVDPVTELMPSPGSRAVVLPVKVGTPVHLEGGKQVKSERPFYPPVDKAAGRQGDVFLVATIGLDGRVNNVETLSGPSKTLEDSAAEAVSHWLYAPYLLHGKPVEMETIITVAFHLGQ